MRNRLKITIAVVGCVLVGFGGTTVVVGILDTSDAEAENPMQARAPQGEPRVEAKVNRSKGPPLGIASYRSQEGKRCFAEGLVVDGKLSSIDPEGGFEPKPLDETGMCVAPGAPAALSMGDDHSDPSRVIVSGLAPIGSRQVEVTTREGRAVTQPSDDGAFMMTVPAGRARDVQVRITAPDGSITTQTLRRLPAPDPDVARRQAMEDSEAGHTPQQP